MGGPVFPNVTITFDNGKPLLVTAPLVLPDNLYVQSLRVQRKDASSWLPVELLADGGNVEMTMGPVPNEAFGANPMDRPPRFYL